MYKATPILMKGGEKDNVAYSPSQAKRYALPSEIANITTILVSGMSRMIVGDTIYMTGEAGIITNEDVNYRFD